MNVVSLASMHAYADVDSAGCKCITHTIEYVAYYKTVHFVNTNRIEY